ncbi:LysR family transcriptional regulator [Xinfangfangia pollutisoli]|uniref:LysR family transcriptional regulator n=1 Tax=Xinfangfangia pollutisoli TaxID=2865960 RepID=UPI001CD7A1FE|nr:LysR family transcriptional regulator [Xinfangfangia pollutisoli]
MDLQLIRSFVEVATHGSFAAASERLFVTQSAVSLRIQRLEEQLGRPLFLRSKEGVTLTPAGREFRSFALTIMNNWEQARRRVSAVETAGETLALGAQASLWPRLGFRWLDALQEARPGLHLTAEMATAEGLAQMILSGAAQAVLTYAPLVRPGLSCTRLIDDQLVLVSGRPGLSVADLEGRYVLADWGADFLRFHEEALPALKAPPVTMGLGALAGLYIGSRGLAAYLPARYVRQTVETGALHLVPDAPAFAHPIHVIWRDDLPKDLADVARMTLEMVAAQAEADTSVMMDLV